MKFVPGQKILYLKQLTVERVFPLFINLIDSIENAFDKRKFVCRFLLSSRKHLIHFFYSNITHFKTKNLATFTRLYIYIYIYIYICVYIYIYISFSVPENQPAKIFPKVN